jgi:hypothetical protein
MGDDVKVTILGVSYAQRQALRRACLDADVSLSAALRERLPQIVLELEGQALPYAELTDLLMATLGVLNMSLAGLDAQALAAYTELGPELGRFKHQVNAMRKLG